MKYFFFLFILICSSCTSKKDIKGTWNLTRIHDRNSATDHSLTDYIRQGTVKRTMKFDGTSVIDVEYRDGKLRDSIHATYRITEKGTNLFIYQNNEMIQFWQILSLGKDSMALVDPANLVFSFKRTLN